MQRADIGKQDPCLHLRRDIQQHKESDIVFAQQQLNHFKSKSAKAGNAERITVKTAKRTQSASMTTYKRYNQGVFPSLGE